MNDDTITALVGGEAASPVSAADQPPIEVIGRALNGNDIAARVLSDLPDVLILDAQISDPGARSVCRRIREWAPATRVLAVTPADDEDAYTTVVAGAAGAVLAATDPAETAAAVAAVARGESVLPPRVASRLMHDVDAWAQRSADPLYPPPTFTTTERVVLEGLSQGQSPASIAAEHSVTPHLVNLHAGYAVAKLHRYVLGAERIAASEL